MIAGWRIDYFIVSQSIEKEVKEAKSGSYIYNVVDVEQYVEECKEKKDN